MKLLTATITGQGARANDYNWTVEGELVGMDEPCARDARDPDGGCGCGRAFFGFSSHRSTTTARVRDLPLTHADLALAFAGFSESAGYGSPTQLEAAEVVEELVELAAPWPVGAVLERRLGAIRLRAAFT